VNVSASPDICDGHGRRGSRSRCRSGPPWFGIVLVGLVATGCLPGAKRLDEAVFHDEPGLTLKVVRWYENLPFHYTGEVYVVECRSEATRDFPAAGKQDAGWRMLGNGGAIGTRSAADLLPEVREQYRVLPGPTLLALGTVFRVSFDGCGELAKWDPTSLPAESIHPAPKPDFCAPKGSGDCRYMDFQGDHAPAYGNIEVDHERGLVAFTVHSAGLRPPTLRVRSTDRGRSWTVEPIDETGRSEALGGPESHDDR
jgi:hypothetical protein